MRHRPDTRIAEPTTPRTTPLVTAALPLPASRPRRLRVALLALAALLAALALGASVAVHLARGAILARAESAAAALGLALHVRDVDVPIFGGIGLVGVEVRAPDGTLIAELARVETDVTLIGAALGERRPGRIALAGGSARLRWRDGLVDLTRGDADAPQAPRAPAAPLTVEISDLDLVLEASHTTPLGAVELTPLQVRGLEATLRRDAQRRLGVSARGELEAAGHRTPFTAALDLARGSASFEAADGIQIGAETSRGPIWVALNAADHEAGGPWTLRGLGARVGARRVQVESARLLAGDALVPTPAALERVELAGIAAESGVDEQVRIASAAITFAPTPAGPAPSEVTLRSVEMIARRGERRVSGRVASLTLGLSDLAQHLAAGSPLSAVSAIKLATPQLTLVVPSESTLAAAATGDLADQAQAEPEDEPPPFLGNEEDLPPPEAVVPALAPGRDWLAALLGADDDGAGEAALARLIPSAIAPDLAALVARLGALGPEVTDGTLQVIDETGRPLIKLDRAGFSARTVPEGVALGARAAVWRNGAEAGYADLRFTVTADLALDAFEGTLSGRSLANQLARFVSGLSVQEDAELDLQIRYERPRAPDAPHHVTGTVRLARFSFSFWRIADREIRDLEARVRFEASIDRKTHRLLLSLPEIEVGQARLSASLDLTRKKKKRPSFVARVAMARQDCGAVARSIPRGLIPNLPTLALEGQMEFEASLALDLDAPRGLELDVRGDLERCRVLSLGPDIDLDALRGPFVHVPREPKRGLLTHIEVGRGTPEWVPGDRIPEIVKAAAWVTEDRRWTEHGGVRWDLVERALKIDLEHGRFIYGGSTITQQLVKNLYLTRDKNLARKLEEAIIAWQMERVLTKDEILEIYINCIEYGPDIYGLKQAARIYFGKRPRDLDALEAAFIMGLKPYPKAGYNQFMKGRLDPWWVRRVSHVLRYIAKFAPEQLTLEEAESFDPFQPAFREPR